MIEIISGTNRLDSNSIKLAGLYAKLLSSENVSNQVIDLTLLPDDFTESALYNNSGKNSEFNILVKRMLKAEKYIFIVPEYNGSFPGVLKAFIDGLKFPDTFTGKKAALTGLSSGTQGGGLAISHLTDILNYCGTSVLAKKPRFGLIDKHLKDGEIKNPLYLQLIKEQISEFLKF